MTTQNEEVMKEFEDEILGKKYGNENLDIFTVPQINREYKCWAITNVTKEVKDFILSTLSARDGEWKKRIEEAIGEDEKEPEQDFGLPFDDYVMGNVNGINQTRSHLRSILLQDKETEI